jgi:hypothetical protein
VQLATVAAEALLLFVVVGVALELHTQKQSTSTLNIVPKYRRSLHGIL